MLILICVTNDCIEDVLSNEESNGLDEDANSCLVNVGDNQDANIFNETIRPNSVESDHRCKSSIYFDNAGYYVTLTLYNVTLTSQKPC